MAELISTVYQHVSKKRICPTAAFTANVTRAIHSLPAQHAIQYGCALEHGAFENLASLQIAPADQALIFFLLRLIRQLNALGPAPPVDLLDYLNQSTSD